MIKISRAKPENKREIWAMANKLENIYGHILSLTKKREITQAIKNNFIYLAKINNQSVGYLMVELLNQKHPVLPGSIFVHDLFVEEKFRKQGIGKKLVKFALVQKHPSEYIHFSLTHSPQKPWLSKYYEQFGFRIVGKTNAGNIKLIKNR